MAGDRNYQVSQLSTFRALAKNVQSVANLRLFEFAKIAVCAGDKFGKFRFIQLYSGGGHLEETWDAHESVEKNHGRHAGETDQPIAALLTDLAQRGLLDSTLVVWGGEFGRMPFSEGVGKPGRNHNPYGFSMWMAGGGVKGGVKYGETDELGFAAETNKVHVHDLHATILHLMGMDHTRLTYFHQGRDERLTDVYGNVVKEILA